MSPEELLGGAEAIRGAALARHAWLSDLVLAGIGWATVELERAERELEAALGGTWLEAETDGLLGATARLRSQPLDGVLLAILEPSTEGLLAASLARFGEGVAAIYLARGVRRGSTPVEHLEVSRIGSTPLGPARLVLRGPLWGPGVIVLEGTPSPALAVDDLVE